MVIKVGMEQLDTIVKMAQRLWPEKDSDEILNEMKQYIGKDHAQIFLYEMKEKKVGFALCSLRYDTVEGTRTSPVGFLEGIYVREKYRRNGIATELLDACEAWAKEQNCIEFASSCERGNTDGFLFHIKKGYDEVNRIICFKKNL